MSVRSVDVRRVPQATRQTISNLSRRSALVVVVDNVLQGRRRLVEVCLSVYVRATLLQVSSIATGNDYDMVVSFVLVIRLTPVGRLLANCEVRVMRAFCHARFVLVQLS